jgi:hypothetical protein
VREGPLYRVGVGARPVAIDGAVLSGGGNGEREMEGEGRGWAAAPFWVEWRGAGGELVAGGE